MKPKENPEDRAARLRERRLSGIERTRAAETSSASLTTDLRAIYGLRGMTQMMGVAPPPSQPKPAPVQRYR